MNLSFPNYKSIDDALDDYPGFYVRMPFVIIYQIYSYLFERDVDIEDL